MSFKKRGYSKIVEAILEDLSTNSQVTDTNIGSVSRTLVESVSREISGLYDQMELAYNAGFIDTASGKSLDMIVAILGLKRKSAQYATGSVTFSRRNPSENVRVLRGTRISTAGSDPTHAKLFETARTVELAQGENEVEAPIKALIPGEAGMTDFETISVLEVPIIGIDKVMNKKPTTIGTKRESDDEFRRRARSYIRATGKATSETLRSAIMDIPGVRRVTINEMPNEIPGEVDIIIDGLDLSCEDTKDHKKVRAAIETVRPAGIHVDIQPTESVRLDIRLYVKLNEALRAEEELEGLTTNVKAIVTNYIRSLDIGEDLVRNKIISTLFKIPDIYNIDNLIISTRRFDPNIGGLIEDTNQRLDPKTQDLQVGEYERLEIENVAVLTQYSLQAHSVIFIDLKIEVCITSKTISLQKLREQAEAVVRLHLDKLEGGEDIDYIRVKNLIFNIDGISEINNFTISAFHENTGLIIKDASENIKTQEREKPRLRNIIINTS